MTSASGTADLILSCAQSLIVAGGYNGFSYADIAKVVGIRNASIHHHFPAKADLVRTLVARYRKDAETGIAGLERSVTEPVAQLRAYTGYWKACIADVHSSICVCALLAAEIPVLPEEVALEVRAHFRGLSAWLASVFERGARDESLKLSSPPKVEAEIFLASIHGAMLSARAYRDGKIFGEIVDPLVARLVR
ncbi:TetR/AcrR family transcriptional regulator [Herbaspirillum sp. alder98]|uniref:TetR/AcrR family transcriptional regulator n=1 Tax=Herbaspirillum sp. alder98 TaxID=2913096 RepID=UPI001CD87287|nr:TetR/AcrR family transcriptional regulator [Herbaspirillum sp. alder98]MCA1323799.1 TetR/AcrR family transcriptional regulator [Herbaspirillum sp. alder98]